MCIISYDLRVFNVMEALIADSFLFVDGTGLLMSHSQSR